MLRRAGAAAAAAGARLAAGAGAAARGSGGHEGGARAYATSEQMRGMKKYKPTTPGFRGRQITSREALWKGGPYKPLTVGMRKTGGRNNKGRITMWHRGGGHKRKYRMVDFKRAPRTDEEVKAEQEAAQENPNAGAAPVVTGGGGGLGQASAALMQLGSRNLNGVVERIEYDPNRSARIALVGYQRSSGDHFKRYILAPEGLAPGDSVTNSPVGGGVGVSVGNAMPLRDIPVGIQICNVELRPGRGGQVARAAGTFATLVKLDEATGYATIKLASGEQRYVLDSCMATIGQVSNSKHNQRNLGKAGAKRWIGRRPIVRGVAMNPVDHPHGGGEGKTSGGRPSVTPWSKPTKGSKTRKKNKPSGKFIRVTRHQAREGQR